jgi:hypothetical protein
MFHKTVEIIDLINTFALLPTALFAIKAFLTKKSLTPKLDRFLIELFWIQMVVGFLDGAFLYHHRLVDITGAIYLTLWRVYENWRKINPYLPSAEEVGKREIAEQRKKAEKQAGEIVRQFAPLLKKKTNASTSIWLPYHNEVSAETLAVTQLRFSGKGWSLSVEHQARTQFLKLEKKKEEAKDIRVPHIIEG